MGRLLLFIQVLIAYMKEAANLIKREASKFNINIQVKANFIIFQRIRSNWDPTKKVKTARVHTIDFYKRDT